MNFLKNYAKEIAIGILPVTFLFLAFIGVNVGPLVVLTIILIFVGFYARSRAGATVGERRGTSTMPPRISFDDIGGQERAKRELKEALDFLNQRNEIAAYGIRPLKGILLTGPPGTGKTLMAKASAHYTDSVFMSASGSEFIEMYVGVGAQRVRDLFKDARVRAKKENKSSAILFIDEIDVVGGKRDGGQHREYDQTLNQLLTEMDGVTTDESPAILIIAATNRKDMLDPALLRPGRFDRHITVDLPDLKARKHILSLHAKKKPMAEDVDMEQLAKETFGFSGAQLESVMNEAAIYSLREQSSSITAKHLAEAVDKVMMGERSDRETVSEERDRVAIHELGHALVSEMIRPGSVSQVVLSPRGQALGYVRHHPDRDYYLYTRRDIEGQIRVCLAGAAAEELIYGERSTGSKNDFDQAMNMVRTLIDTGLSTLGIVDWNMVNKQEVQKETTHILNRLMEQTKSDLQPLLPVFDQALGILVEEETLSGDRFRILMEQWSQQPALN
jgi:cell division protease FtsH